MRISEIIDKIDPELSEKERNSYRTRIINYITKNKLGRKRRPAGKKKSVYVVTKADAPKVIKHFKELDEKKRENKGVATELVKLEAENKKLKTNLINLEKEKKRLESSYIEVLVGLIRDGKVKLGSRNELLLEVKKRVKPQIKRSSKKA